MGKIKEQKKKEKGKKLYIVSKMVMATSIYDALKKEKNIPPDDIYIDADWKKNNL